MRPHLAEFLATLRHLLATPVASALNILIMGIAISLPAGLYVLMQNMQAMAGNLPHSPQISVFLALNANKDQVAQLGKRLAQHDGVDHAEFVPREQALESLQQSSGMADVIAGLKQNPLPDAYVVYPKSSDSKLLDALRAEIRSWPGVEQVQFDAAWARKLDALLGIIRGAAFILAGLLSLALVAITFNTIRLQILTRREEIEVAKLIGATDGFIRRPFLYFGFVQGLLGGAAAWLILSASVALLNLKLGTLAGLYGSSLALQHLAWGDSLSLLLFAAYLGWLGAWLSVSQHLWQIEPH